MRCPKCGFISFDDQVACAKCHLQIDFHNLPFQGTAIQVETVFFLGGARGEPETDAIPVEETEAAADHSLELYEELAAESLNSGLISQPAPEPEELVLSPLANPEAEGIAFPGPAAEEELLFEGEGRQEEPVGNSAELGLDAEAVPPPGTVNLDEIDLSDLVAEPDIAHDPGSSAPPESVFDLSDIISDYEENQPQADPNQNTGSSNEMLAAELMDFGLEDPRGDAARDLLDLSLEATEPGRGFDSSVELELHLEMAAEDDDRKGESPPPAVPAKPAPSGLAMEDTGDE